MMPDVWNVRPAESAVALPSQSKAFIAWKLNQTEL
jgi:hypothetical protein